MNGGGCKLEFCKATFAQNVKQRRNALGFTQKALAEKIGMSLRGFQDLEAGKNSPSIEIACKLATVFNCKLDELCTL